MTISTIISIAKDKKNKKMNIEDLLARETDL